MIKYDVITGSIRDHDNKLKSLICSVILQISYENSNPIHLWLNDNNITYSIYYPRNGNAIGFEFTNFEDAMLFEMIWG